MILLVFKTSARQLCAAEGRFDSDTLPPVEQAVGKVQTVPGVKTPGYYQPSRWDCGRKNASVRSVPSAETLLAMRRSPASSQ